MKRIVLTLAFAGALAVGPAALLAGSAGAANPHGGPADPNGSCAGKPTCNNSQLPQSDGCLHGQAPVNNPHCQATTTPPTAGTPVTTPTATPTAPPAQGVAGAEAKKKGGGGGNVQAATAVRENPGQLPFTGLDTLWLVLIGAGTLASGLALRARASQS